MLGEVETLKKQKKKKKNGSKVYLKIPLVEYVSTLLDRIFEIKNINVVKLDKGRILTGFIYVCFCIILTASTKFLFLEDGLGTRVFIHSVVIFSKRFPN